jgi:NAD(P)-dependent dehydrogenase (short-subunit alcohol dehydrogenase family)
MVGSKALALEYAANNIRFNTVPPGNINTPMHAKDNHEALAKFHPLGRMGEISDIVATRCSIFRTPRS